MISYVAAYYAVLMGFGIGHRYTTYFNLAQDKLKTFKGVFNYDPADEK